MRFAILVDHKPHAARAGRLLSRGKVEIPRPEDVRADPNMTEVGMIALKGPLACWVGLTANLDSRIALAWQTISKLEFKVPELIVLPDEITQSVGASVSDNHAVANGPVRRALRRRCVPAFEPLTVENRGETVTAGLSPAF